MNTKIKPKREKCPMWLESHYHADKAMSVDKVLSVRAYKPTVHLTYEVVHMGKCEGKPLIYDGKKHKRKKKRKEFIRPECVQRIYTFYALELLYHQMKSGAYNQWFTQDQIDEVEIELEIFANKLKLHLLDVVEYSVSCEIRHTYTESSFRTDKHLFTKEEQKTILYMDKENRRGSIRLLSLLYNQPSDRIDICKRAFDLNWEPAYGGKKWADACRAWMKLYHAKKLEDVIFWIDRVYDLQHNNGVLFNKHKIYDGLDHYIHEALDQKRYASNIYGVAFKNIYANQYAVGLLPLILSKYYKLFTKYLRRFPHYKNKKLYELQVVPPDNFIPTTNRMRRGHVKKQEQPRLLKYGISK